MCMALGASDPILSSDLPPLLKQLFFSLEIDKRGTKLKYCTEFDFAVPPYQ
jgi:hypothetical protein